MSVPEGKTAGEPRKQHVVSRVLLDRWAVDGEVEAFNLTNGRQRPRSPSAEGWVERNQSGIHPLARTRA